MARRGLVTIFISIQAMGRTVPEGDRYLHVNRGFGFRSGRVGMPPEITVLTLAQALLKPNFTRAFGLLVLNLLLMSDDKKVIFNEVNKTAGKHLKIFTSRFSTAPSWHHRKQRRGKVDRDENHCGTR